MSGIGHKQEKCSVSKASDQAGLCRSCCSRRNSSLSIPWGCWSTDLLAGRCLQPKEQGLKWGEELSYQQFIQQMWVSMPRPRGWPEKWSPLLRCWPCLCCCTAGPASFSSEPKVLNLLTAPLGSPLKIQRCVGESLKLKNWNIKEPPTN